MFTSPHMPFMHNFHFLLFVEAGRACDLSDPLRSLIGQHVEGSLELVPLVSLPRRLPLHGCIWWMVSTTCVEEWLY